MRRFSASMICDIRGRLPPRFDSCPLTGLPEQAPGVQGAADRPGLCGGAAGMVRWISVENLTDCAHRLILQCVPDRLQQSLRCRGVAAHAISGEAEWSEQPAPDRPLVIAAVALAHAAAVARTICGLPGRQ